jgi:AcrR family transcriptional regulator
MPKLAQEVQAARRDHILDAAEACFTLKGFHGTSMQDICRRAGVSPGALYIYFASKDDLIIGLADREKLRFMSELDRLSSSGDFLGALKQMAEHFCCEEPRAKLLLHIEIGAEAARNHRVQQTVISVNRFLMERFSALLDREVREGRVTLSQPVGSVVRAMAALGDGIFWHRALDPEFDPRTIIPAMMTMMEALIKPSSGQKTVNGIE